MAAAAEQDASTSQPPQPPPESLIQYVVLRRDLWTDLKFPLGAVTAQACHASAAAIWLFRDEPETQAYLAPGNLDNMHKARLGNVWKCVSMQHGAGWGTCAPAARGAQRPF